MGLQSQGVRRGHSGYFQRECGRCREWERWKEGHQGISWSPQHSDGKLLGADSQASYQERTWGRQRTVGRARAPQDCPPAVPGLLPCGLSWLGGTGDFCPPLRRSFLSLLYFMEHLKCFCKPVTLFTIINPSCPMETEPGPSTLAWCRAHLSASSPLPTRFLDSTGGWGRLRNSLEQTQENFLKSCLQL